MRCSGRAPCGSLSQTPPPAAPTVRQPQNTTLHIVGFVLASSSFQVSPFVSSLWPSFAFSLLHVSMALSGHECPCLAARVLRFVIDLWWHAVIQQRLLNRGLERLGRRRADKAVRHWHQAAVTVRRTV